MEVGNKQKSWIILYDNKNDWPDRYGDSPTIEFLVYAIWPKIWTLIWHILS